MTDAIEAHPERKVGSIEQSDYQRSGLKHVFLTGDLQKPSPHGFFRDGRVEMVVCLYDAGDDGRFHWHAEIDEYQLVLSGRVGLVEAASGRTTWHGPGDLSHVPAGVCVQRLVPEEARTVALKVPSLPGDKVHCDGCARPCDFRAAPYRGVRP